MSIKIFRSKLGKLPKSKYLIVDDFPILTKHKIGYEPDNQYIVLLINSRNEGNKVYRQGGGKYLSIIYDVNCTIKAVGKKVIKNLPFTILMLKSKEIELENYFLELSSIFIKRLGSSPSIEEVQRHFEKLESIFTKLSRKSNVDILGLWGELFLIDSSADPEYLIKAWHKHPYEKIDFNDGKDKIEVKSTTSSKRIHHFEIKQLHSFKNSNSIIASIMTSNIDNGTSVTDLVDAIKSKISNESYEMLLEKVFSIIGDRMEEIRDVKYDYNTALSELKYFNVTQIPKPEQIPTTVNDVKFTSSLEDIKCLSLLKSKNELYRKLYS